MDPQPPIAPVTPPTPPPVAPMPSAPSPAPAPVMSEPAVVPQKSHTLLWLLVLLVLVLLGGGAYFAYPTYIKGWLSGDCAKCIDPGIRDTDLENANTGVPTPPRIEPLTFSGSELIYRPGNFAITPVTPWVLATTTPPLPEKIEGYKFALVRPGSTCVLAFVVVPEKSLLAYKQTSFAERVFSGVGDKYQFDSSWYILGSSTPPGFAFKWQGKQPFKKEVRIIPQSTLGRYSYGDNITSFLLYDAGGEVVSDACNSEVNSMLRTWVPYYDEKTLTSGKEMGTLFYAPKKLLFLSNDGNDIIYSLGEMDASKLILRNNELYTIEKQNLIKRNLFTNKQDTVLSAVGGKAEVLDVYFYKNHIYSLQGTPCDKACAGKLYDFNTDTGASAFLADVKVKAIGGFSESEQALYLIDGYGDAGCVSTTYYKYGLVEGAIKKVDTVQYCEGDKNYDATLARKQAILDKYKHDEIANFTEVSGTTMTKSAKKAIPNSTTYTADFTISVE